MLLIQIDADVEIIQSLLSIPLGSTNSHKMYSWAKALKKKYFATFYSDLDIALMMSCNPSSVLPRCM